MYRRVIMTVLLLAMATALQARADDTGDCKWPEPGNTLVKTDPARVASACRRLADQGVAIAQWYFGSLSAQGQGVPQSYAEAVKWYRKAANQGFAMAQYVLGLMYEDGRHVPQNYAEAVKFYRMAADQGDSEGQLLLGLMYEAGRGVPQDYVLAHMWFNLAAARAEDYSTTAAKSRDRVAAKMTPTQIEKAQALAATWKPTTGQ